MITQVHAIDRMTPNYDNIFIFLHLAVIPDLIVSLSFIFYDL